MESGVGHLDGLLANRCSRFSLDAKSWSRQVGVLGTLNWETLV